MWIFAWQMFESIIFEADLWIFCLTDVWINNQKFCEYYYYEYTYGYLNYVRTYVCLPDNYFVKLCSQNESEEALASPDLSD